MRPDPFVEKHSKTMNTMIYVYTYLFNSFIQYRFTAYVPIYLTVSFNIRFTGLGGEIVAIFLKHLPQYISIRFPLYFNT